MTRSALDDFLPVLLEMMKDPPDPNEPLPLTHRRSTAYGVAIPFHVLSWIAVGFRLHTRFRVVREPGWDDAFVVIAAVLNLVAMIGYFGSINRGVGQHIVYAIDILQPTMAYFYVANAAYTMTAACIKLSLLLQYLRVFREGKRRIITLGLLAVVILWGGVFSFMGWVPCFPVSGFWNKQQQPPPKCYGFGYRTLKEAKDTLFVFSGSNMVLDLVVFLLPLTEYFKPNLRKQQVLAMTGLFALGSIVILMAVLRLWSGLKYNNTIAMFDFTWWLPEVLLFSCLEIDFAIMCASMPIFWPTVMAAWTEIFVTREVLVTHDRRSRFVDNSVEQLELSRSLSVRSHKSTERLTKMTSREGMSWFTEFDPETGTGPGCGITQVEIQPCAQKARIL
ncbi:hypothetical protein FB567DRAFT_324925 [Paraphoma chrysanthemicola]|uniref:Rhodopsin domain-containing protein n=1 Tax=Paraphoma chrysanthemicola TaxID=798071 RepID=A0A8K0W048_9PLEO|nr:hypothetical protein FB567DRAFT_324925 [Paraphoma chrysanthemicola]